MIKYTSESLLNQEMYYNYIIHFQLHSNQLLNMNLLLQMNFLHYMFHNSYNKVYCYYLEYIINIIHL